MTPVTGRVYAPAMTFHTEWDTTPNPVYDVWTSVNGSEIVPGILSPLMATTFNRYDGVGLQALMDTYPGAQKVELFDPPIGNFFGIVAGRLCLNNGFSVAATSALDADIAQAILQQFFTGASGGERFIIEATDEERAAAYAVATQQREDAPAKLDGYRDRLYAERASDRFQQDLELDLPSALARYHELHNDSTCEVLNTHYMVSVGAGEWQVRLAILLATSGLDPAAVVGLCSGLGEVESSKPAIRLFELAQLATAEPDVEAALRSGTYDPAAAPADSAFRQAFATFLFEYGYRVQGEADPTNPDWSENPTFALSQIAGMLDVGDHSSPKATTARAVQNREALETVIRAQLPPETQAAFDEVLGQAQRFTRMRERSKAMWVLAARRTRAPYLAMGRRLIEQGLIDEADDAKYLLLSELEALADGTGPSADEARARGPATQGPDGRGRQLDPARQLDRRTRARTTGGGRADRRAHGSRRIDRRRAGHGRGAHHRVSRSRSGPTPRRRRHPRHPVHRCPVDTTVHPGWRGGHRDRRGLVARGDGGPRVRHSCGGDVQACHRDHSRRRPGHRRRSDRSGHHPATSVR